MVHPDRLERYKDFVEIHSDLVDGQPVYNPNKAFTGLLSILSPDPKVVVLAGMEENTIYFPYHQLHRDVLLWLNNLGVAPSVFPITLASSWNYLVGKKKQERYDGSLVEIGAVVREAHLISSWGDDRTGYIKSRAGSELAVPLFPYACEFVSRAKEYAETQKSQGKTPHEFDSMWRIIGSPSSQTDRRRPWAVFKVIEFLIQNPGFHRCEDLIKNLGEQINYAVISHVLNSLGKTGIIDYYSPFRDIDGKRTKGWIAYKLRSRQSLQDFDNLYQAIKDEIEYFENKGMLGRLRDYILENPDTAYEANAVAQRLAVDRSTLISHLFSSLAKIKVLQKETELTGGEIQSQASANDLTKMFNDMVLSIVRAVADTLTSPPTKPLDPPKLTYFLQNYQTERSYVGPTGGEEVRECIIAILANYPEPMKLSHITQEYNHLADRQLFNHSIRSQLRVLIDQGLVKSPRKGYYSLN